MPDYIGDIPEDFNPLEGYNNYNLDVDAFDQGSKELAGDIGLIPLETSQLTLRLMKKHPR